uniref:START domain-containing protein n=1 Tax=Chromera velia CCMP2878 TaxID=1169474 RepID=A0A0G4G6S8_9ALVE|eukprot:Cvel_4231.t1-p1 / transcript=Cvel_4231.t1 / gene=Cvel_4231 / organism=Chromera_velia_CCMP2878 / gene_product=hypothetical protein / transcript_product=hypothetical protein / location=Cvel_scaffold183:23719-26685(-) / protein_length=298 / sequence_SO=supercontig / SO=protein_coding / is_pseudo=false
MIKIKDTASAPVSVCTVAVDESDHESAGSTLGSQESPQVPNLTPVAQGEQLWEGPERATQMKAEQRVRPHTDPDAYIMSDVPLPRGYSVRQLRELAESNGKGAVQRIMKLATETEGWVSNGTHKGVTCEMKPTGDDHYFVCRGRLNFGTKFNAFDFIDFIHKWENARKYDHMLSEGPSMSTSFDAWPEPQAPSTGKRAVRMHVATAGYVFRHLEDGSMEVTTLMVADMKVKLPKKVMDRAPFLTEQPSSLGKIKALMYKEGVRVNPLRPWDLVASLKPLAEDVRTETEAVRRKYHIQP